MGLPIHKTPENEIPRKPITAVVPDHCFCGHSAERHRGPEIGKNGGPCYACKCVEYRRRPCKCGHQHFTHNEHCTAGSCRCLKFEEDSTPRFLIEAGYTYRKWFYGTLSQFRYLQRPNHAVQIRIWATITIHAAVGKRERLPEEENHPMAWLAVTRDKESRKLRSLQPVDIENELNEINQACGEEQITFNSRRECRALEEQGAIIREKSGHDQVRIFLLLEPGAYRRDETCQKTSRVLNFARTDLSAFQKLCKTKENYLRDNYIVPKRAQDVKEFAKFIKHHVSDVVITADRSVRFGEVMAKLDQLRESVCLELIEELVREHDMSSVSNGVNGNSKTTQPPAKKNSCSTSQNPAHSVLRESNREASSSSAVNGVKHQKAEDEEEDSCPTYQQFRELYPQGKLDDAKARRTFNALAPLEKNFCLKGLIDHLVCERWVKSLANNKGKYIPLASNFIARREYAADPPPHIDIEAELTPAERREQHRSEQLAASARELYERLLRNQ